MKEFEYPEWNKDRSQFFGYFAVWLIMSCILFFDYIPDTWYNALWVLPIMLFSCFQWLIAMGNMFENK